MTSPFATRGKVTYLKQLQLQIIAAHLVLYFRRDRVSLKSLSLERKLELVAGDEEFLESFVLGNATALQAVAARSAGVRDLLTQALDHS